MNTSVICIIISIYFSLTYPCLLMSPHRVWALRPQAAARENVTVAGLLYGLTGPPETANNIDKPDLLHSSENKPSGLSRRELLFAPFKSSKAKSAEQSVVYHSNRMPRREFVKSAAALISGLTLLNSSDVLSSQDKIAFTPRSGEEYFKMLEGFDRDRCLAAVNELKAIFEQEGEYELKYRIIVGLIINGFGNSNKAVPFSKYSIQAIDADFIPALTKLIFNPATKDELQQKVILLISELSYKGSNKAGQSLADIICSKKVKEALRLLAFSALNELAREKVPGAAEHLERIMLVVDGELFPILIKSILEPGTSNEIKRALIPLIVEHGYRGGKRAAYNLAYIGAASYLDAELRALALSELRNLKNKRWTFYDLEKMMPLFEKIAAEDISEKDSKLMGYRYKMLESINDILQYLTLNGPEPALAVVTLKKIYKKRGERNILSRTRGRKGVILVLLDTDFRVEFSHGEKIVAVAGEVLGNEDIEIKPITIKNTELISPEDEKKLRGIAKENPDKTIVVNISLGSKGNLSWIRGLLNPKLVEELGQNTVFVLSGGNRNIICPQTPPEFDNVLYIGGVTKNDSDNWVRWSIDDNSGTSVGPDIFGLASIYTVDKQGRGTSFAAPRVAALLSLILNHNLDRSIPDCKEWLKRQALPLKGDRLFHLEMLGAGVFDTQKINTHIYKGWEPPDKKEPAASTQNNLSTKPADKYKDTHNITYAIGISA